MMMLLIILSMTFLLSGLISAAGNLLSKKLFFDRETQSPFECGFSTLKESQAPFSLRFFILALIFVVFDVEIIIMLPFIFNTMTSFKSLYLLTYLSFVWILGIGLVNEWNQNMLEWVKFY